MLVGRQVEQEQIELLLEEARLGRGGALVLRGEAGIGKTTLLKHAVEQAGGFRVLRALGVEAEAELPFAALHELVRPILPLLDELPEPQSAALKGALALVRADGVDRFTAYAATLGLLSAAAADQPVLCIVDDAHWLDQESAEALVFSARRIENEAVFTLFAARDPTAAVFASPGIPELALGGLAPDDARALLAAGAPSLTAAAAERLVEIARVNPLALLEFAPALAEAEGREALDEPLPSAGGSSGASSSAPRAFPKTPAGHCCSRLPEIRTSQLRSGRRSRPKASPRRRSPRLSERGCSRVAGSSTSATLWRARRSTRRRRPLSFELPTRPSLRPPSVRTAVRGIWPKRQSVQTRRSPLHSSRRRRRPASAAVSRPRHGRSSVRRG